MQRETVEMALELLSFARQPRTTVQSPEVWSEDQSWRAGYAKVDPEDAERLRAAGDARRRKQQEVKDQGGARSD